MNRSPGGDFIRGAAPDVTRVLECVQPRKVNVMFGPENLQEALAANKGYQVVRDGDSNDVKPSKEAYALTDHVLKAISEYAPHLPNGFTQIDLHKACRSGPSKFGPILFGGGVGSPFHVDGRGTLGAFRATNAFKHFFVAPRT